MKTITLDADKVTRHGAKDRPIEARPPLAAAARPVLRTRLVAACGWPTDAEPLARRRAAKR
ncbi:MAG: hypothetical protein E6Q93_25260 [Burkholderiaceae bacterium]|nr:MAG: hypothetical protein E6Q93_25260 [Burkholderiaceae bacterium]